MAVSVSAPAVNPNCIKTLFANGFSTFPIKGKPAFTNGPKILPGNPPNCPILCHRGFGNFMLANELFANTLPVY